MEEKKIGIYEIKNNSNNKSYIGLSTSVEDRMLFHKRRLLQNTHKNKHLQSSFNKYGIDSFEFNIIEECDEEMLPEREKYWIQEFKSHDRANGYNKTYGGEFGRLSDEIVQSTANKLRGRTLSEEMKNRIRETLTGKKQTPEAIQNRVNSIKKLDDSTEELIVKLYIENDYTKRQIAQELNIKNTTIDSVIHRSGELKKYNYKENFKQSSIDNNFFDNIE